MLDNFLKYLYVTNRKGRQQSDIKYLNNPVKMYVLEYPTNTNHTFVPNTHEKFSKMLNHKAT